MKKDINKEIREQINHVKSFNKVLNEENEWDPFKAITYIIKLKVLFEGFEYSSLEFKLLFPHYETISDGEIKNRIDERLKVFNNIVNYDIIEAKEASGVDKILPMY